MGGWEFNIHGTLSDLVCLEGRVNGWLLSIQVRLSSLLCHGSESRWEDWSGNADASDAMYDADATLVFFTEWMGRERSEGLG